MGPRRIVIEISSSSDEDISPNCKTKKTFHYKRPSGEKRVSVIRTSSSKKYKKKKRDIVQFDDDCIILDSDPDKRDFGLNVQLNGSPKDLLVVAERGQVACRDYPHARHLCMKFHFKSTSHHKHCELCYCYVCDVPAPCSDWNNLRDSSHCHASDKDDLWKMRRKAQKLACTAVKF
ncbi:hypothetical protein SUGI_0591070 [Cryptomeria japonica]|uniref:RPM1 interacting protein 13 n=1 Tax=Cryptomeria japonica TaxID=3369 RepID=UPI0024149B27|nr:RPM1 interacting protein 13 [Cryptomeria japonica]GLJ29901.1 hypothetical protein SUGI_0591070 [Cryptomeria japonica]